MFFTRGRARASAQFALKPMNCPGACLVFGSERHSYRDLPLRLAEFGLVHAQRARGRAARPAARPRLHPGRRARLLHRGADRATRSTRSAQAIDELYARFGFDDVRVELSTRPEKSIGTDEQWERAEAALREALERQGREYDAQPRRRRLLRAEDRLPHHRRARPLLAVRHLPARLLDARALRPHLHRRRQRRAPAGDDPPRAARLDGALRRDPDRALRAASFPVWLAPVQAVVLPVADRHDEYAARGRRASCARPGVRVRGRRPLASRSARRSATPSSPRCPYMLVVGDREAGGRARSPCAATARATSGAMPVDELADRIGETGVSLQRRRSDRVYTAPRCRAPTPRRAA